MSFGAVETFCLRSLILKRPHLAFYRLSHAFSGTKMSHIAFLALQRGIICSIGSNGTKLTLRLILKGINTSRFARLYVLVAKMADRTYFTFGLPCSVLVVARWAFWTVVTSIETDATMWGT